ncbi:UPF0503 protein [Spatholobus suberectus]|nr:UPF0503 protein [Spatholobus suberectus]
MTSKPHRLSACHRHPTVPVTGFCALCLRERLAGIRPNDSPPPPPDLRRSKSCSRPATADAHRRLRSCEARPRSTLSDLFTRDDTAKTRARKSSSESEVRVCDNDDDDDNADEETKTVKEFIDLELQRRKRNAARDSRTFWNAAAERFKKWKWKHRSKKNGNGDDNNNNNDTIGNAEKRRARRLRETQSEIGECNLGRRSCDTDPRFSIDAGRISFDCPRASWDGCLLGRSCSRLSPMVSLDEDVNSNDSNGNGNNNGLDLESSGDGRRSFGVIDRSNSRRRQSIGGLDELKLMSNANANANANAKVSPATFYGAKLLITEKELMDSYVRSSGDAVQPDCVMESDSKDVSDVANEGRQKGFKKLHKWRGVWSKLGLVQSREDKLGEEEGDSGVVVNDKPLAESLQRLRRVVNVQASEPVGQKLMRSYSVSCRSPCGADEDSESKGSVLNGRQEFMFQRNRSVRSSPNNPDTGLLRFYLTPTKSYKRSKAGRSSVKDLHSMARSGL